MARLYPYYLYKKSKREMYRKVNTDFETVSPEEKEILRIVMSCAEMTPKEIAKNMGTWDIDHITRICNSIGKKDLVDFLVSGKVIITPKGERALGR